MSNMLEGEKCFRHLDRQAVGMLKVVCAPQGRLMVCDECIDPANGQAVFEHYRTLHSARIAEQLLFDSGTVSKS